MPSQLGLEQARIDSLANSGSDGDGRVFETDVINAFEAWKGTLIEEMVFSKFCDSRPQRRWRRPFRLPLACDPSLDPHTHARASLACFPAQVEDAMERTGCTREAAEADANAVEWEIHQGLYFVVLRRSERGNTKEYTQTAEARPFCGECPVVGTDGASGVGGRGCWRVLGGEWRALLAVARRGWHARGCPDDSCSLSTCFPPGQGDIFLCDKRTGNLVHYIEVKMHYGDLGKADYQITRNMGVGGSGTGGKRGVGEVSFVGRIGGLARVLGSGVSSRPPGYSFSLRSRNGQMMRHGHGCEVGTSPAPKDGEEASGASDTEDGVIYDVAYDDEVGVGVKIVFVSFRFLYVCRRLDRARPVTPPEISTPTRTRQVVDMYIANGNSVRHPLLRGEQLADVIDNPRRWWIAALPRRSYVLNVPSGRAPPSWGVGGEMVCGVARGYTCGGIRIAGGRGGGYV